MAGDSLLSGTYLAPAEPKVSVSKPNQVWAVSLKNAQHAVGQFLVDESIGGSHRRSVFSTFSATPSVPVGEVEGEVARREPVMHVMVLHSVQAAAQILRRINYAQDSQHQ